MAAFEYVALNDRGRQQKGLIEGETSRQVREQLRGKGLIPVSLREVSERNRSNGEGSASSGGFLLRRGSKLSTVDLSLFTRQLATLLRSGLPLDESLSAVAQQSEGRAIKRVALGVRAQVIEGASLAGAMADFPNAFPPLFRATIEAGEQSGKLDGVLVRLADYVESRQAMRQKMMLAAFYPAILTVVAISVVILLLSYVVPQVVGVFDSIDQPLPPLTLGLIAVSDFLRSNGPTLLLLLVAGGIIFSFAMRRPTFKRRVHGWQLRIPMIGRLTRGANTGRFMRTLGILSQSGVPILEAMRIGSQVVSNVPMRDAIEIAARKVREGGSVYRALSESKLFPPITLHLLGSGEQSGRLDEMLEHAADSQEREVETTVSAVMGIFEPVLILVMGGVVLLIVLAILLPIFDLNQLVQ